MHLISNSISGNHISLVIENNNLRKAVIVVHNQVFGAIKTINLFAFGKGNVGSKLIDQILATANEVSRRRNLHINVIGVADSKKTVIKVAGVDREWRTALSNSDKSCSICEVLNQLEDLALENIIIADNTSSQELTDHYPQILERGFDIVASNKKANSGEYSAYKEIRSVIKRMGRLFYYETNVGAGLPLIDTLRHLQDSADNVQRVRGVFSGSLSYLFNNYSVRNADFSDILSETRDLELTEPDPRNDLAGVDVARKLIILARELGLQTELDQVAVESLIPETLNNLPDFELFMAGKEVLNEHFAGIKKALKPGEVLRFVGDLDIAREKLVVSLVKVSQDSPLGNLTDADALFEIYTESYGDTPIVIQGAGAGGEVTARGVYSDLLRMANSY